MASTPSAPAKSDSSFGQTLQFITSIKLHELEKQRLAYQAHAKVIDEANAYGEAGDIIKKVQVLANAVRSWTGSGSLSYQSIIGGKLQLTNLDFWLQQAKKDPSFSREIAQGWAETLETHIIHTKTRFDCAKLFGNLFNEWLASGDSTALVYQPEAEDTSDGDDLVKKVAADFEGVGRKEMHEQKAKLESIIFDDHPVDVAKLNEYLQGLFKSEEAAKALEKLRKDLKDHGRWLQRNTVTQTDVTNAISGLLASGLMNEEKRNTLKAFKENPTVLDEVASVLKMRLASMDSWSWPREGAVVEMRRHLNGKYKAFTDPDIIDALLLQYIGVCWQVKIKSALRRLFDSKAWKRSLPPTHNQKEKYEAQLRGDDGGSSIEKQRHNARRSTFFLNQLADNVTSSGFGAYNDLDSAPRIEKNKNNAPASKPDYSSTPYKPTNYTYPAYTPANYTYPPYTPVDYNNPSYKPADYTYTPYSPLKPTGYNAPVPVPIPVPGCNCRVCKPSKSTPSPKDDSTTTSPVMVKQQLLHIMTTECYLNMALHGTHATIRSDLEWFGPSLPHTSILTVLEFLGIPKNWLLFYKAFLSMPVRFSEDAEPRVRKRGTPINYELSVICGEAILFIMDFAVNQRADGLYLYRMHDDLWLWDADVNQCVAGWEEMKKYAALVGLKFNKTKTGSAYVQVGNPISDKDSRLPDGDIRWGFLKFDPLQSRFVIDQKDVDLHIIEFRRQLLAVNSVFGWINVYNKYMAFFLRNFGGTPANCFGQQHVVDIIDTLGRIQRDLFAGTSDDSAVGYLRKILQERFDINDLPEGYFYLPISCGGLELRNTMLEVLSLSMRNSPLSTYTFKDKDAEGKKVVKANKDNEDDPESALDSDSEAYYSDDSEDWDDVRTEEETLVEPRFTRNMAIDQKRYDRIKETWDLDTENRRSKQYGYRPPTLDEFMSFTEYTSLRESWLSTWGKTYKAMLDFPSEMSMTLVPQVKAEIENGSNSGSKSWYSLTSYEKWIVSMYGEEVVKKFGGLEAVDRSLIPTGMVELFKTSRLKLDQ